MLCPDCQAPIDIDTVFCGHCGVQLPPTYVRESTAAHEVPQIAQRDQRSANIMGDVSAKDRRHEPPIIAPAYPLTPTPVHEVSMPATDQDDFLSPLRAGYPIATRTHRPASTGRNLLSIAIILALLGVGIAASVFAFWQNKGLTYKATPAKSVSLADVQGTATFSDGAHMDGSTNSVTISINGLHQPPKNSHYEAWIIDDQAARIHSLGTLVKTGTVYATTFSESQGTILSLGDKIQVTVEAAPTSLPAGRVLLSSQLPAGVVTHVNSLLVSYPTTLNHVALLPGLRNQTQLVYTAAQQLKAAKDKRETLCLAQNILTILSGPPAAPGIIDAKTCKSLHIEPVSIDMGLLGHNNNGYVYNVGVHASLASTQPDSTANIRLYAQQIVIASDNIQQWLDMVSKDASFLLKSPTSSSTIQMLATLASYALNGLDSNHDGQISPTAGEAGVIQAYSYGQSMATLKLTIASLK